MMNKRIKDLTGQTFGRLTALEYIGSTTLTKSAIWRCLCSCGNEKEVVGTYLKNGHTQSCGCLHREQLVVRNKTFSTHGLWSDYYQGGFSSSDLNRWYHHKMTPQEFERRSMEQENKCDICNIHIKLVVDHDHKHCSGRDSCPDCWRGLICGDCNVGLGAFKDSVEALRNAADYLEKFNSND